MDPTMICNTALTLIGVSTIASIEDETNKAARVCKANFDATRDEVLAMYRWSFAKGQDALSRLTEAPRFKWNAAFQLPADYIRLCEIEGRSVWEPKEFFDIHGRKLVMRLDEEETVVNIEYIRREEDVSLYSPLFCEALAHKLAAKVAVPLTESDAKALKVAQDFETKVLPRCQTMDAQQRYSGENHPLRKFLANSQLVRARSRGV